MALIESQSLNAVNTKTCFDHQLSDQANKQPINITNIKPAVCHLTNQFSIRTGSL